MSTHLDPYSHRGQTDLDPYSKPPRPLPRRAETPTPVGAKSLKRLKSARRAAPDGRAAACSLSEWDREVAHILEWATYFAEGIDTYRRNQTSTGGQR